MRVDVREVINKVRRSNLLLHDCRLYSAREQQASSVVALGVHAYFASHSIILRVGSTRDHP